MGLYYFAFNGAGPAGGMLAGWLAATGGTALAFTVAGVSAIAVSARRLHGARKAAPEAAQPGLAARYRERVIDLRTDTLTQPTQAMRRAIAEAVVGDEQKREDPTVIALEERGAALLGQEEAVFVPTATMANQIALRVLSEPGDEVLAEELAHIFRYELGGPAVHSGLVMKSIRTEDGRFGPEQIRDLVNPPADLHMAPTKVLCLENTHNAGGGRVWPLAQVREVVAEARAHGLSVHLDGARLMNASVASGTPAADYGREFDTVALCLSKGLGCPLGALVAGSTRAHGEGAPVQAPLRRRDAPGRDRGGGRAVRARPPRRAARRRPRQRQAPGRRPRRGRAARRRRAGGDELRAPRRRGARARRRRGSRAHARRAACSSPSPPAGTSCAP